MTRVGLIKPTEVKEPQAETKPKEPAQAETKPKEPQAETKPKEPAQDVTKK